MTTSPAWRARYSSTANSRAVSSTGAPARVTARVGGSTTQVADAQHAAGRSDGARRTQRPQPREQLAEVERLDEVVVGAGVEAADAVATSVARGEHEDRRPALALAQRAADREAVAARQHHVEDDRVVVPHRAPAAAGVAVDRHVDGVALVAQPALQRPDELRVVLDDEQPHLSPGLPLRPCPTSRVRGTG